MGELNNEGPHFKDRSPQSMRTLVVVSTVQLVAKLQAVRGCNMYDSTSPPVGDDNCASGPQLASCAESSKLRVGI